jgi:hypothetical protein
LNVLDRISISQLAERCGAQYDEKTDALRLRMLGQEYRVRKSGVSLRGQKAPEAQAALIMEYLAAPAADAVLTPYRALSDFGASRVAGFRSKVDAPLSQHADNVIEKADALLPMLDAEKSPAIVGASLAVNILALPKIYIHAEFSGETEDFPPEAWVLFSHNASAFLSPGGLLALGELFKDRLVSLLRIY